MEYYGLGLRLVSSVSASCTIRAPHIKFEFSGREKKMWLHEYTYIVGGSSRNEVWLDASKQAAPGKKYCKSLRCGKDVPPYQICEAVLYGE